MIVLDTHALIWWTLEPTRLGSKVQRAIETEDRVGVPAVVFWEVALLARRGYVTLGTTVAEWMRDVLSLARLEVLPLTAEIAVRAEELEMHPDPADRFIVATALHHGSSLASRDKAIRKSKLVATVW